jgi:chromosome segregation ATPase
MTHDPKKHDIGELRRRVGAFGSGASQSESIWMLDELERRELREAHAKSREAEAGRKVRLLEDRAEDAERERDEARAEAERLRAECDLLAAAVAAALVPDRNGREVAGRDTFEDGAQHVRNKLVSTLADWPHTE